MKRNGEAVALTPKEYDLLIALMDRAGSVSIRIYALDGSLVYEENISSSDARAQTGPQETTWDGRNGKGEVVRNGAYVCVLNAGGQITGGGSFQCSISGDGASVVFLTQGTNIDVTDVTPNDIYMRVNWAAGGTTVQISEHPSTTGTGNSCQLPATNTDGSVIVWHSASFELVNGDTNADRDVFRRQVSYDRQLHARAADSAAAPQNPAPAPDRK